MNDPFQMQRELRYGAPVCDQILTGRHFTIGYSWYFRQAKWVLEIINPLETLLNTKFDDGERLDNFRADQRIPWRFRASLGAYKGSGFDRGHLAASANLVETPLQNSETFLLSNMAPQNPNFNRSIWKKLEVAVRELNAKKKIFETYVISGPLFFFDQEVVMMDSKKKKGVTLPIPHAFFKSVLAENNRGKLNMWSFIIPNELPSAVELKEYQVATSKIEKISGLNLWESLVGAKVKAEKDKIRKMW